MPFLIVRQDITKMKTDAIVNAANTDLLMGGGVCGAIFRAAGAAPLQEACRKHAPIRTGEAVLTPGFALKAKFIIHAAGPIYCRHSPEENRALLYSAYRQSLLLAQAHHCESIAFPLISSGIYGYPREEALQVATEAIRDFLETRDMEIYLAVFDRDSFRVSSTLMDRVAAYLDDRCISEHSLPDLCSPVCCSAAVPTESGLEALIGNLDVPFNEALLRIIDARGLSDAQVYHRANIDRKLFSKIRTGKDYTPGKRTVLALAIALELSLEETDDLLERAGYALSPSKKFDVIVEYFIGSGSYDIFRINEVLFRYGQPLLGAGA